MPDLDIVTAFTCSSNEYWSDTVPASGGGTHLVEWKKQPRSADVQFDWSCTCKGFQFRRQCKHIEAVKSKRCGWNAELEPTAEPIWERGGHYCPECHAPTVALRVGV